LVVLLATGMPGPAAFAWLGAPPGSLVLSDARSNRPIREHSKFGANGFSRIASHPARNAAATRSIAAVVTITMDGRACVIAI